MNHSTIWWILCGLLVATELTIGTLYLLLIALGCALAAVLGYFEAGLTTQITAAALLSVVSCVGLYLLRKKHHQNQDNNPASNNLDIGQIVQVKQWNPDGGCSVFYRGTNWQAKLAHTKQHTDIPTAGAYTIVDVEGSFLILQACS